MASGIFGATILNFVNGTTEDGPSVTANDNQLKTNGVNNDGGLIQTDGSGGLTIVKLVLSSGSLSRIERHMTIACINGSTTFSHTLGVTPDFVFITINAGGIPTSGLVAGYDPAALSSTQVKLWANGNFNVDVLLIKL